MGIFEEGKERIERFIAQLASDMKRESAAGSFVWWTPATVESNGAGGAVAMIPMRIYRGSHWRAIEFDQADVRSCVASPEVLNKYQPELAEILSEP
jgi:hypothetical protein